MRVGLTGGVGSGKSTVAAMLAGHGALVLDADEIAREVVQAGSPGFEAVLERFGATVVAADGSLDRAALATRVFGDESERAALNAIVHPLVGARFAELMAAAPADAVVIYDVPLLVEGNLAAGFDAVVVVEADVEVRVARLAGRGMSEADARARMAAQASDEQRRAVADELIENSNGRDRLQEQVDALWERLQLRASAAAIGDERRV